MLKVKNTKKLIKNNVSNIMNILNVTVMLDPVFGGGTAERTYQMSKALVRAGANCVILTTDVGLCKKRITSLEGVKVVAQHCIYKRFFVVHFSWLKLKKLVVSADIIHLMGHWNMLNVLVYLLARQTDTPYVICPAGELPLFGRSRWIKKLFNAVIGYRVVRDAAGHIAVTPDEIPAYENYGIKTEFVTVIPNGVNEDDFQPGESGAFSRQFGLGNNPFILFMGRLNTIKGPDLLLEAFCLIANQFPAYHLVFAGPDGGLLNNLKQTAKERGVSNKVHFVGYVAGKDKTSAYHEADFLVIPSRQEAMSIVVLESGISGTPVLITDQCGFDEVASINGGKVVPATVQGLQTGLIEILSDINALKQMGDNLNIFVRENFQWSVVINKYVQLYRQILTTAR